MNRERVQQLRDHIASLPASQVYLSSFVSDRDDKGCGTVCCVAGWACVLFDQQGEMTSERKREHYSYVTKAAQLLGITLADVERASGYEIGYLWSAYWGGTATYPSASLPCHHKAQALARLDALLALPDAKEIANG